MTPARAVVFDLGKVLLDFDFTRAARALASQCDVTDGRLCELLDQTPLLHQYERGELTSEQFFAEVQREAGYRGDSKAFALMFGDIFTPVPEMLDLQVALRSRGIPTYIFSNTSELAVMHIRERYPFFAGFDGYVFSYEAKSMKPDAQIYRVVEDVTRLNGADLLYIDDRLENIATGRERGWRTIHHTDPAPTIAEVNRLLPAAQQTS